MKWTPYLALAILPFSVLAVLNHIRFSWGYHHGFEPLPPELLERAERLDRYLTLLTNTLTVTLVVALLRVRHIPVAQIGLQLSNLSLNVRLGLFSGLLLFVFQGLLWKITPASKDEFSKLAFARGNSYLWCIQYIYSVFAEELWLVSCIALLRESHSAVYSVLFTASAFGVAHISYGTRALATASLGAVSATLFLLRVSFIPPYLFHLIGNIGALYWARRNSPREIGAGRTPLTR